MKSKVKKVTPPVRKEKEQFQDVVIEGQILFRLTIKEDNYFVESFPDKSGEIAAILIARDISDKMKIDMEIAKKSKLIATDTKSKSYFKGRYDSLIKSCQSLGALANNMIMTVLKQSQK